MGLTKAKPDADKFSPCKRGAKIECKKRKLKIVELIEVVKHKGKEHSVEGPTKKPSKPPTTIKGHIKRTEKAKGAYNQYVNLDDKVDKNHSHPEYGNSISYRARVEWNDKDKAGLANQTVYWYFRPHAKNRKNRNKILSAGELKQNFVESSGFSASPPRSDKIPSQTDKEGWTGVVTFYPTRYGGDRFKICATLKSNYKGGLSTRYYGVWRRMWYQVTEMPKKTGVGKFSLPSASHSLIREAYEKVYVELWGYSLAHPKTPVHKDNFDKFNDMWAWGDKYTDKDSAPWKIHFCIVNHCAMPVPKKKRRLLKIKKDKKWNVLATNEYIRPYDFNGEIWNPFVTYWNTSMKAWRPFPTGTWEVKLTGKKPWQKIIVIFKNPGVFKNKTVKLQIEYKIADPALGWGGSNLHCMICRGASDEYESASDIHKSIAKTSIHEAGHGLRLVYNKAKQPWKTPKAKQSAHCKFKQCVMWYQAHSGKKHYFHDPSLSDPGCHTWLRQYDMSRANMQNTWKFPR